MLNIIERAVQEEINLRHDSHLLADSRTKFPSVLADFILKDGSVGAKGMIAAGMYGDGSKTFRELNGEVNYYDADAAKAAFEVIREAVGVGETQGETVIIATVHGDIHDIGKNIVKVLLENYGYRVLDLGKDVPVEAIVNAAKESGAKGVGLSALMTTTVGAMEATIKALQGDSATSACQIVVGGAVLTQEYADQIGASHYAPNAVSAVNYVNNVFGK